MFETGAVTLLGRAEWMNDEITDETLEVQLDTGGPDVEQSANNTFLSETPLSTFTSCSRFGETYCSAERRCQRL